MARAEIILSTLAVVLAGLVAETGGAQVVARQGSATPNGVTTFASPMILEVPAHQLRGMRAGLSWLVSQLAGYSCEGTTIPGLLIQTSGDPAKSLKVTLDARVALEKSYDREATLLVELLADDRVIGSAERKRFELEEKKERSVRLVMKLDPESSTIFKMGTKLTLRVTLSVFD